jgi:hypothetical protein
VIRYSLDKKAPGMFATDHGAYVKVVDLPALPRLMGVGRDEKNSQALCLFFEEPPTDDQLRQLHDFLSWMSKNT